MTKTEQAQALFTTVTDNSASVIQRREAMEQLTALKKAARTSFAKLGVDEEQLKAVTLEDGVEDTTEVTDQTPDNSDSSEGANDVPAEATTTRGKRGEKRDQAIALLSEVSDKSRREQVQHLIDNMGINANAAYYFARTCQD